MTEFPHLLKYAGLDGELHGRDIIGDGKTSVILWLVWDVANRRWKVALGLQYYIISKPDRSKKTLHLTKATLLTMMVFCWCWCSVAHQNLMKHREWPNADVIEIRHEYPKMMAKTSQRRKVSSLGRWICKSPLWLVNKNPWTV